MMGFFCKKTYCCNIYSDIDLKLNEHIICIWVFLFTEYLTGQILRKGWYFVLLCW